MRGRCQFGKTWPFVDIIDSWKLVGWRKGFKAQTCWTDLLAFWGVWNWSRILNFGPDWLFFGFSRALVDTVMQMEGWCALSFELLEGCPCHQYIFSCSTQLSMKFVVLINLKLHVLTTANSFVHLKLLTTANSLVLNIAEHENFSANKYENANYWIEHEKSFITSGLGFGYLFSHLSHSFFSWEQILWFLENFPLNLSYCI